MARLARRGARARGRLHTIGTKRTGRATQRYATRHLAREDFSNDKVDAGDIGSGHRVRAIYEIVPAGSDAARIAPERYAPTQGAAPDTAGGAPHAGEYAFVKVRYKHPGETESRLLTRAVTDADATGALGAASDDARFASAVAGFGELLRGARYTGEWSYDDAAALATGARGTDADGYRAEFARLVRTAASVVANPTH